jgi:hypothetical protein
MTKPTLALSVLGIATFLIAFVGVWALCCAAGQADDDSARVAREEGWK